jgi:hypothetical protein
MERGGDTQKSAGGEESGNADKARRFTGLNDAEISHGYGQIVATKGKATAESCGAICLFK